METIKDYQSLAYELILRRAQYLKVAKGNDIEMDIQALKGLINAYLKRIEQLSVEKLEELQLVKLNKAKANYFHFQTIRKSHPEIVSEAVDRLMDNLALNIAKWEGHLLFNYAEDCEDFNYMGFRDYMLNPDKIKAFHNNYLFRIAANYKSIRTLKNNKKERFDSSHVTIFLDETNKNNPLAGGELISNYSYIIATGVIKNESKLNDRNIICKKVGQAISTNQIEEVTCEGIGNALFTLLYEYNYTGNVDIRIDNLSAKMHWKKRKKNFAVYKCFSAVNVKYVSRNKNRKADALSRQNIAITMSKADFDKLDRIKQTQIPLSTNDFSLKSVFSWE